MFKVIKLKVQETEDGMEEKLEGRPETVALGKRRGQIQKQVGNKQKLVRNSAGEDSVTSSLSPKPGEDSASLWCSFSVQVL